MKRGKFYEKTGARMKIIPLPDLPPKKTMNL